MQNRLHGATNHKFRDRIGPSLHSLHCWVFSKGLEKTMPEMLEVSDNYIMCSAKAVVEPAYAAGAHTVGYTMESKTELLTPLESTNCLQQPLAS